MNQFNKIYLIFPFTFVSKFVILSAEYIIRGVSYTSPDTEFTLDAANASALINRTDIVAGSFDENGNGVIVIIKGDEGATAVEPIAKLNQELSRLKMEKNDITLDYSINQQKVKTEILSNEVEIAKLNDILAKASASKVYHENAIKAKETLKLSTNNLTGLEQLDMELKLLIEDYLVKTDENVKNAFGENIKFKLFEANTTNDNLSPVCDMYVKDTFGRWVNVTNGINTGHTVPRIIEFITMVKRNLDIKDSMLLIDFFESVGNDALEQSLSYGQQLIATQVIRGQNELRKEKI